MLFLWFLGMKISAKSMLPTIYSYMLCFQSNLNQRQCLITNYSKTYLSLYTCLIFFQKNNTHTLKSKRIILSIISFYSHIHNKSGKPSCDSIHSIYNYSSKTIIFLSLLLFILCINDTVLHYWLLSSSMSF